MRLRLLRVFLLTAGFGWAISIYGVFAPWSAAVTQLQGLGAGDIPHDPMLDYWLRMAAGAFTGVGLFFFALACNPKRCAAAIPPAGLFLIAEGLVLLVHGLRLGLEPLPFFVDTTFCLFTAVGIWLLRGEVNRSQDL
ncbi:MAG TPA: hypothetical protein VLI39_10765 [Sedimentisphaerales bacterium]|nr:hypothetical protein [Sedimentisphaerales bacterium]